MISPPPLQPTIVPVIIVLVIVTLFCTPALEYIANPPPVQPTVFSVNVLLVTNICVSVPEYNISMTSIAPVSVSSTEAHKGHPFPL